MLKKTIIASGFVSLATVWVTAVQPAAMQAFDEIDHSIKASKVREALDREAKNARRVEEALLDGNDGLALRYCSGMRQARKTVLSNIGGLQEIYEFRVRTGDMEPGKEISMGQAMEHYRAGSLYKSADRLCENLGIKL